MNIYLEIFGYIGTALVILSMMMTSVLKLRIINICGGVISLIYAILCRTWPVALLNFCLVVINSFHTVRGLQKKTHFGYALAGGQDGAVQYFLSHYAQDIGKLFKDFQPSLYAASEAHQVFVGGEMVGLLIGKRVENTYRIELDYVIPRYRNAAVGKFLFSTLKEEGVSMLIAPDGTEAHNRYLVKLGFANDGDSLVKKI